MIDVKKEGILVHKTTPGNKNNCVQNPTAIRESGSTYTFYNAVSKTNYLSIGYCKLKVSLIVEKRFVLPIFSPHFYNEIQGIKGLRITKFDDQYYLTCTAHDEVNAFKSLTIPQDFRHFFKKRFSSSLNSLTWV